MFEGIESILMIIVFALFVFILSIPLSYVILRYFKQVFLNPIPDRITFKEVIIHLFAIILGLSISMALMVFVIFALRMIF